MPAHAAILALEHSAAATTGEHALAVARVNGDALRAGLLEHGLHPPIGHAHDRVAGGDEEGRHPGATKLGKRPASKLRTKSPRPWSKEKPRP